MQASTDENAPWGESIGEQSGGYIFTQRWDPDKDVSGTNPIKNKMEQQIFSDFPHLPFEIDTNYTKIKFVFTSGSNTTMNGWNFIVSGGDEGERNNYPVNSSLFLSNISFKKARPILPGEISSAISIGYTLKKINEDVVFARISVR